jgi:hypothetical protein
MGKCTKTAYAYVYTLEKRKNAGLLANSGKKGYFYKTKILRK